MEFKHISVIEAKDLIQSEKHIFVIDLRDEMSYTLGHVPKALHASEENMTQFLNEADRSVPVICYCYRGISSQGVAQALIDQGFESVYSLDGGYDAWQENV